MVVAGTRVRGYDVARNGPTSNGSAMVLSLDDISYFITVQLYVGEPMFCIMITSTVHELHWYLQ